MQGWLNIEKQYSLYHINRLKKKNHNYINCCRKSISLDSTHIHDKNSETRKRGNLPQPNKGCLLKSIVNIILHGAGNKARMSTLTTLNHTKESSQGNNTREINKKQWTGNRNKILFFLQTTWLAGNIEKNLELKLKLR